MRDHVVAEAALKLYIRQGVQKTSAEEIARACGTTRMTLYRNYGTKEDIVRFVVDRTLADISATTDSLVHGEYARVADFLAAVRAAYAHVAPEGAGRLVEELAVVAPELEREIVERRRRSAERLVDRLIAVADAEHGLNPDIHEPLRRVWVDLAIRNLPEVEEESIRTGPPEQLLTQVAQLLLYGLAGPQ
jgi:AcrR family transcriptional regulator